MLYTLEQGPTEKAIIERCYRQREPLPAKIANAPELCLGLSFFFDAYLDLATCRSTPESPISWLSIDDYCDRRAVWGDQRYDLHYHVQQLDQVYHTYRAAKLLKELSKGKQ